MHVTRTLTRQKLAIPLQRTPALFEVDDDASAGVRGRPRPPQVKVGPLTRGLVGEALVQGAFGEAASELETLVRHCGRARETGDATGLHGSGCLRCPGGCADVSQLLQRRFGLSRHEPHRLLRRSEGVERQRPGGLDSLDQSDPRACSPDEGALPFARFSLRSSAQGFADSGGREPVPAFERR